MKANALALSLILILVPLAGCSGTDTEVNVDLSNEEINELIDDNLEDVMNNTTVVVFQDYYNNTTIINEYSNNSTSNLDQSGSSTSTTNYNYNGTNPETEIYFVRIEFNASDLIEQGSLNRDNNFTVNYSYYDYATNDDRNDLFTLPCSNYYDVLIPNSADSDGDGVPDSNDSDADGDGVPDSLEGSSSYWQNSDYYWQWWDEIYNNTIRDLLSEMAYSETVLSTCQEPTNSPGLLIDSSGYSIEGYETGYDYSGAPIFFEMTIPNGSAIKVLQVTSLHEYTYYQTNWFGGSWVQSSQDRFWTVNGIHADYGCQSSVIVASQYTDCGDGLYGGWADIQLDFQVISSVYHDSKFVFTMYYEMVSVGQFN